MHTSLLRKCSITYLFLPNLLFLYGWFRPELAILVIIGYCSLIITKFNKDSRTVCLSLNDLLIVTLLASICVVFSGVGGLSSQSMDWLAHNAKFHDLYYNQWPIYFPEIDRYACHYFGFYLVPAFLSKKAGLLVPFILITWTAIGFILGLSWIFLLLNKSRLMFFLFLFLRGTGQFVIFLLHKLHLFEIYVPKFNPSVRSLFEQNAFVPNQVIPALIGCGILLYDFLNNEIEDDIFFIITLTFIWGVFPSLSLLFIFSMVVFQKYILQSDWKKLRLNSLIVSFFVPGVLFLPTFIYFLSSQTIKNQGFLWSFQPRSSILIGYLSGYILDSALFYVVILALNKKSDFVPVWFINVIFAGMLLASAYRMGIYNDLFFRGSISFCILIFIILLRGLQFSLKTKVWPTGWFFYTAGSFLIGMVLAVLLTKVHLLRDNAATNVVFGKRNSFISYNYDTYPNTYQALVNGYHDKEGADQYLAVKNSLYLKYLCKKKGQ